MPQPVISTFLSDPMFSVYQLTAAINRVPYEPGLIGSMNLFTTSRLTTTIALFEERNNTLALVPERPRGSPADVNVLGRRSMVPLQVPHFPLDASMLADEIMGVRAFGTDNQLEAWGDLVSQHQTSMGTKLDVTLEWLRLGAVKGIIITRLNRDTGAVEQSIDLFQKFGVQPQAPLDWPILPPAAGCTEAHAWSGPISGLCLELRRAMAAELGGLPMGGIQAICGSAFFDAIASAPELRQTFLNTAAAASLRDSTYGLSLSYRGVTFTEYLGQVGAQVFVEPDECYFFPGGVPGLFLEAYSPADYIETVNTPALPRYSKMEAMDFDLGVMIQSQMNVLPVCTIPRCLFHATASQAALAAGTVNREAPPPNGNRARVPA